MRRARLLRGLAATLAGTLLIAVALSSGRAARAQPLAARVIDRALLCSASQSGGIYEIEARANEGVRETRSRWKKLAYAVAESGQTASAATVLDSSLAWITAGRATAHTQIGEYFYPVYVVAEGTVAVSSRNCRLTSRPIPLSTAGLQGGPPGQLGEVLDCPVGKQVLVRVRARLASRAELRQSRGFLRTTAPVTEASLVVRTLKGKPLMYAEVVQSGKARLLTAPSCIPR